MEYVAWDDLGGRPNIIVDGYPATGTVLALSHWRGSGCPEELADDLSTQIAFRYLDRPDLAVEADAVSNNHFDEDGLCGIYAVLHPDEALARRDRLIQVASTGDFDTFTDRDMARVAFALGTLMDEDRSPLGDRFFSRPYPQVSAALYKELLVRLPEMVDAPDRSKDLWEAEDAWLFHDEALVGSGAIGIEERPEIDLAIVTLPEGDTPLAFEDEVNLLDLHVSAVHTRTRLHRILAMRGRRYQLRYRYETWVKYVSAPTIPRVDLGPLAEELSAREAGGKWEFDGVESITPSLHLEGADESTIRPEVFLETVTAYLSR
ncbi:MAG: DUF6687 family protein [Actinomycetota bacterium]